MDSCFWASILWLFRLATLLWTCCRRETLPSFIWHGHWFGRLPPRFLVTNTSQAVDHHLSLWLVPMVRTSFRYSRFLHDFHVNWALACSKGKRIEEGSINQVYLKRPCSSIVKLACQIRCDVVETTGTRIWTLTWLVVILEAAEAIDPGLWHGPFTITWKFLVLTVVH